MPEVGICNRTIMGELKSNSLHNWGEEKVLCGEISQGDDVKFLREESAPLRIRFSVNETVCIGIIRDHFNSYRFTRSLLPYM